MPNADRINELYYGNLFDLEMQQKTRDRVHWICSQARGARVLDLGCSQGIASILLGREGFSVIGVDLEEDRIGYANEELAKEPQLVRDRVVFQVADASQLPLDDASFDTVILGELLEHLTHPQKVLEEVQRVLAPEGRAIITVPFGLHPHQDHKHTYYPLGLIKEVQPFLDIISTDIRHKNILMLAGGKGSLGEKWDQETACRAILKKMEEVLSSTEVTYLASQERQENRVGILRQKVKGAEGKATAAAARQAEVINEVKKLSGRLEAIEAEEELLGKERDKICDALEAVERSREDLNNELGQLHARTQRSSLELESAKTRVKDLEQELEKHTALERGLQGQLDAILNKKKSTDLKVEALSIEKERLSGYVNQMKSEWREVLAEVDRAGIETGSDQDVRIERLVTRWLQLQRIHEQATSGVRWKIGDAFVRAAWPSTDTLKLPGRLAGLFAEGVGKVLGRRRLNREKAGMLEAREIEKDIVQNVPAEKAGSAVGREARVPEAVSRLQVAAVMDTFSEACIRPECQLVTFRPDNFKAVLASHRPDFLLVESAWHGNDGAWQYRVASYIRNLGNELESLVFCCKERGIPTVFWNKEDPVHFKRFLKSAGLFDTIFTSDAGKVHEYRRKLGHDRVYTLLLGAQPALHNPVVNEPRELPVCFAGSYWADRYEQREKDMEILLKPAMDLGLHIFDRNHGLSGLRAAKWRFPKAYQPAIQGRLEYDEMVEAYKRYRVFLNVNSVKDSHTMFPRRIFELMACGTPVISAHARGIEEVLGEDAVLFSSSEKETLSHLQRLLEDDDYWARRSLIGIRKVMSAHTYEDRIRELCRRIGLDLPKKEGPTFSVLARAADEKELEDIISILKRQIRRPEALLLLLDPDLEGRQVGRLEDALAHVEVVTLPSSMIQEPRRLLEQLRLLADRVCVLKPYHHYGPHYLEDYFWATRYTDSPVIGKHTHFSYGDAGKVVLEAKGSEYRRVKNVPSATVAALTSHLTPDDLLELLRSDTFEHESESCLSLDRFNYVGGSMTTEEKEGWRSRAEGTVDV